SSVTNSFPARAAGRSSGAIVLFDQYPLKSGLPSGRRGAVHVDDFAGGAWAAIDDDRKIANEITVRRANREFMVSLLFSVGPTRQFSAVHRFAASSHLAGPPTPGSFEQIDPRFKDSRGYFFSSPSGAPAPSDPIRSFRPPG